MRPSGRQGGHQPVEPDNIQYPPEIVSECGQAELGADLLQATHQKRTLVHPLLDRAKRVFDRLTTAIEDTGPLRQSRLHPVQYRFVLKPGDRAKLATRALRADLAIVACQLVNVVDLLQSTQKRRRIGMNVTQHLNQQVANKMLFCGSQFATGPDAPVTGQSVFVDGLIAMLDKRRIGVRGRPRQRLPPGSGIVTQTVSSTVPRFMLACHALKFARQFVAYKGV
jgi:hypothetical protein